MRVAVLGTGRMGALRAHALAREAEVEAVLVGGSDPARARALAADVGGEGGTVEEALAAGPDAVVIASATPEHPGQIALCAAHGLPILCEKPIALSTGETSEAIAAAAAAGVELQVAFQRRFDPALARARALVADGSLGTVYSLRLSSHDHEPSPERYVPGSGGIFRDLHVHDFDLVRWLTGAEVERVYATGAVRGWERYARHGDVDTSAILLTLAGGIPALVGGARHDPRGYDVRVEILGSADAVVAGLSERTPLRSLEPGAPPPPERPWRSFPERFAAAFATETAAFLDLARRRRENPCPGSEALAALRVAIACDRSRAEGRPVALAEVED